MRKELTRFSSSPRKYPPGLNKYTPFSSVGEDTAQGAR